jgi:hypothetical protein
MSVSKGGTNLSEATFRGSSLGKTLGLAHKHELGWQHSSLLQTLVNFFIKLGPVQICLEKNVLILANGRGGGKYSKNYIFLNFFSSSLKNRPDRPSKAFQPNLMF